MRKIPSALLQHLQQSTTTLTLCWKLTPRPPAQVLGFTEHHEHLIIDGLEYKANSSFAPSAIRSTNDLAVDNFDINFLLNTDGITEQDLLAGKYDNAAIELFLVNYAELTMGQVLLATGTIGEITIANGIAKAEVRGLTQALQQNVLEITSPTCRAELGDDRCKVNLERFDVKICDKTLSTCKNTFNNLINYRGEPHLPGNDKVNEVGGG
jgi:uncharacterized phage protein (TIGR02218 family)